MVRDGARSPRDDGGARSGPVALAQRVRRLGTDLALLLLPPVCAACAAPVPETEQLICRLCWSRLSLLPRPACDRCGHPILAGRSCPICALLAPFVRAARSLCWIPDDPASAILGALKYDGWHGVGREIGARLARLSFPPDVELERTALVPVPLAAERRRERGFNQAEVIAEEVAARWGVPVDSALIARRRATRTQTRLTPGERLANVQGAFSTLDGCAARVRGKHLILVDDVLTTGATLNACAGVLFEAGARTLSFLTFGRARTSGDR